MSYLERLKQEKRELDGRLCKLLLFIQHGGQDYNNLEPRHKELLTLQSYWMQCYQAVLEERLKLAENQQ